MTVVSEIQDREVGGPSTWSANAVDRLGIWSGFAMLTLFGIGFVLSHTIPPPGPGDANAIARWMQSDVDVKRLGVVLLVVGGTMFIPLGAAISSRLKLTGAPGADVLSNIQFAAATASAVLMMVFGPFLLIGLQLAGLSSSTYQLLNNVTWMAWAGLWQPGALQAGATALAILRDKNEEPVFPRWVGWFSAWMAFGSLTGSFIPFFLGGPFAWNGFISFFVAGAIFFSWFMVILIQLRSILRRARLAQTSVKVASQVAGATPTAGRVSA